MKSGPRISGGWCDETGTVGSREAEARPGSARSNAALPSVTGLESGIVSQRTFPLRKWYYANPLWYYHAPAIEHRLAADPKFFELVDPRLRELCRCLLAAGLHTTPSCQGHFHPRQRFERVWDELQREADLIRSGGLVVRDSETDQAYSFSQPDYRLAWRDFTSFHEQAGRQQTHGYIGFAIPKDRPDLAARFRDPNRLSEGARIEPDAELEAIFKRPFVSIYVRSGSREERDATWTLVTAHVKALLHDR
jgi:hypothetical protein